MPRRLGRLKDRKDFLRLAAGRRKWTGPGLMLQALPTPAEAGAPDGAPRLGFTASRKVGGAVARNRAKRRLRAAAQAVIGPHGMPGHDYVVIARQETVDRPYALLVGDLETALRRLKLWREAGAAN